METGQAGGQGGQARGSVCPLDCPDRCSVAVEIRQGADGSERVGRVHGTGRNPLTAVSASASASASTSADPHMGRPFICEKVADIGERVHGQHRILRPWVRVGPKGEGQRVEAGGGTGHTGFRPATWEEALERIAAEFAAVCARSGPEAILPCWYGGSNGLLTGGALDQRFWQALGASRIGRTMCAANTGAAHEAVYGDLPSADPLDVGEAQTVVLWGMNPKASGIHLIPLLKRVKARGGRLIVVDPRRTTAAAMADLHLQPLPGTDVALAMALHHLAFAEGYADRAFLAAEAEGVEEFRAAAEAFSPAQAATVCDIPEEQIRRFAELYAAGAPAIVRCGWGPERNRNGTDSIRAILALPAIYGKFGVRGGGFVMSTSSGYRTDKRRFQSISGLTGMAGQAQQPREINQSRLAAALEGREEFAGTAPVEALYVYNCNPVATLPDQGAVVRSLQRAGLFTVVHEQVWTDTCDLADVVLPATTFLEHRELSRSYGGYLLQYAEPVIAPVGEARSNHAVFAALAARLHGRLHGRLSPAGDSTAEIRMDWPELQEDEVSLAERITDAIPQTAGRWEELRRERVILLARPVQFVDVRPARKIRPGAPQYRPPPADAALPLILISPADAGAITSTGFESQQDGSAEIALSPADAAARGIADGDAVRVENPRGAMEAAARIDPGLRRGVLSCPKGLWRRATRNGWTTNALVPDHVDATGGGACYNDARAEIRKVG